MDLFKLELCDAAKSLAKDQAPGPDGVYILFYCHHWETIGDNFLAMVNQAIHNKKLPLYMTQGSITLYKSGSKDDIGNWRPILSSIQHTRLWLKFSRSG